MSKEAARIIKQIEVNTLPNIVTKIKINNEKEFVTCFNKVVNKCPNTVIMLLADVKKTLYIASHVPDEFKELLNNWLDQSIQYFIKDGEFIQITPNIKKITYPDDSEQIPFKLVDEVNGTAFSILKKYNLQQDESSDEEYGLDI
tara:strand:+ start:150 stop:581 length:432 start_codon:yes stop_codon:yes gene_type:complete